jgi:hypothetical protein
MPTVSLIPKSLSLDLYAGDGVELQLTVDAPDGSPFDLTDGELLAEIKAKRADDDARMMFNSAVDGNVVTLNLTGAQTAELGAFRGAWDCQWTPAAGEPRTLVQGGVTCQLDVTRNGGP